MSTLIEELPLEMQFRLFQEFPPEALSILRESPSLQSNVDGFVEQLTQRGGLTDSLGRAMPPTTALEALGAWTNGIVGSEAFPASEQPLNAADTIKKYDNAFFIGDEEAFGGMRVLPRDLLVGVYDPLIRRGGIRGFATRAELELYARHLVETGRLIDNATHNQVPDNTTPDAALDMIRDGTVILEPPLPGNRQ